MNRDRAAEWRPSWTGGPRFITMWDMKEYLASRLVSLTEHVVNAQCILWDYPEGFPNPRESVQTNAKEVFQEAKFLSLPATKRQAARLYQYAKDQEVKTDQIDRVA